MMNTGHNALAENDPRRTLANAQYADLQQRQATLGNINQWQESRNPYYASLYNDRNAAFAQSNESQFNDSMKRMQLQHAARGTLGGSQETYNTAELGAAKSLRAATNAQQNQQYVQGLRQSDADKAQGMRMQAMQANPYLQAMTQSLINSQNVQGKAYGQQNQMQMQAMQDQAQYQAMLSQIYGQAIGNGMQAGGTMISGMGS